MFLGAEDPEEAVEEIWRQLEEFYALHVLAAAERIQPLLKKGKIEKDDVDALINLMSDYLKKTPTLSQRTNYNGLLNAQRICNIAFIPYVISSFSLLAISLPNTIRFSTY